MRPLHPIKWLLATALILTATGAAAKDRTPEPKGIITNGFILHPGAELALGFDSYSEAKMSSKDGLVDIGVHFNTKLVDEELYSWNNSITFNWIQCWGLSAFGDANGGPTVSVSSSADLFKKSFFRLTPYLSYRYDSEAEDSNLTAIPDNHSIKVGSYFTFQPGEGAIFSEKLGYQLVSAIYSNDSSIYGGTSSLNRIENRITSNTRWNFLQDSHMALDVDFRIITYLESDRISNSIDEPNHERQNPMGLPLRIKYSFGGLFTETLSFDIGAGYSYIYYNVGKPRHDWLLNARLRYSFLPNAGVSLSYKKDFETATYGDFYVFHLVSLDFDALWFEHLQTEAAISYGNYDYQIVVDDDLFAGRTDNQIAANLKIAYHFFPGLSLALNYRYRQVFSSLPLDNDKHRVSLAVSYEY